MTSTEKEKIDNLSETAAETAKDAGEHADRRQELLSALLEKGKNSHNQLTYSDIIYKSRF